MVSGALSDALRETLAVFESRGDPGEPMTTAEVTGHLDVSRRSTYARLEKLADGGFLGTKKVGAKGRVWWRPRTDDGTDDLAALVDDLPGVVYRWRDEPDRPVEFVGGECERLTGHTAESIRSGAVSWEDDVLHPEDAADVRQAVRAGLDGDGRFSVQYRILTAAGDVRWVSERGHVAASESGGAVLVEGLITDISEVKAESRRFERQIDEVFERIDDAFYAVDEEFRFTHVNERAEELLRHSEAELLGESVWDVFPSATETEAWESFHDALETQTPTSYEVYYDRLDFWVEANVYPSETGLSVYFRDVTERKVRERELEQYETLARTASDVIVTVDERSVVRDVNSAVEDVFGYEPTELVGESLTKLMPDRLSDVHRTAVRRYLDSGERHLDWDYLELPGVRADGSEIPLAISFSEYEHDGERYFTGIVRDVTERKEMESDLRDSEKKFRTLAENLEEVVWMTAEDPTEFLYVNPAYEEVWGRDRESLYEDGLSFLDAVHPEDREQVREAYTDLPEEDYEAEYRIVRPDGTVRWLHARGVAVGGEDGDDFRIVGIVEDATERIRQKRELRRRVRQQEVITDFGQRALGEVELDDLVSEAAALVAETLDNDYCAVLDFDADADELRLSHGVGWEEEAVGSTLSAVEEGSQAAYTLTSDRPVVVEDLDAEPRFDGPSLLTDHGVESGISVVVGSLAEPWGVLGTYDTDENRFSEHDVNFVRSVANILATAINRRAYERELVTRRTELQERERTLRDAYEIIADPSLSLSERIDSLLSVVRKTVGTDYATLSRVQDDEYVFEAIDAPSEADLRVGDSIPLSATNCERVVETERTLVLRDVDEDAPELADRAGNAEWGISCYLGAPVFVDGEVYGTFCFYDMDARAEKFSDWEVTFIDVLSNWVGNELERERDTDRLAALNSLNEVVRETTEAVIEQSTREEIEQTVCERLADTDSYLFAWIGDINLPSQTVSLRTEAGVDGFLDGDAAPVGPGDERGEDPTSEVLRTGEVQTLQNVQNDPQYEPWHDTAERHGFHSSAAIPVVHEDTVYGVLNVYAARPRAFEGEERAVIAQLGEIVGHAIAAVERKRALMSNEVVELKFRIPAILDGYDVSTDGRFTLDETVPLKDGEYLLYGTEEGAADAVSAFVDAHGHWNEVTFREDGRFEIRLSDPPILSTLASLGGSIEEAAFEDGTLNLTLHISPSVDARRLIEVVRDGYPAAEMVTRKQVEPGDRDAERVHETFAEGLTDRQRAALRAAYHAGFFEWPREASGQEMAETLGVSPPTFYQHLRTAERKVFDSLLPSSVGSAE
ncbi:PAS domain S-box protein [Halopelagius longus]|uniref:histidine kinase n=1 Tax=Halopelagius longus TaxID=1236180 RepID=A0A1H1C7J6_9EURY|nr:PAS domain S-box protein [Halopelagius longus]RDI71108.1 PAS domain S-box protein [Halopelagius longus]SDQ60165.1 PAS domain S-box-containing protein [Halopelagius longus]